MRRGEREGANFEARLLPGISAAGLEEEDGSSAKAERGCQVELEVVVVLHLWHTRGSRSGEVRGHQQSRHTCHPRQGRGAGGRLPRFSGAPLMSVSQGTGEDFPFFHSVQSARPDSFQSAMR